MFEQAEILRKFQNLFRIGTVSEIEGDRARVTFGDLDTALLPWITTRSGEDRTWWPPNIGEQVLVVSLGGDTAQGVIVGSLFQEMAPAPTTDMALTHVAFGDGTVLTYDKTAHHLRGVLAEGGTAYLEAPGGTTFKGPVHVDGPLTTTETIEAAGNITSGGDVADETGTVQAVRETFNEHGHPAFNTPPTEKME